MVPPPFFGSPPKAYYAHPALLGTWCQSLGSIGGVVSEENANRQTNTQTIAIVNPQCLCQSLGSIGRVVSEKNGNIQTDKQTYTLKTEDPIEIEYRISLSKSNIE